MSYHYVLLSAYHTICEINRENKKNVICIKFTMYFRGSVQARVGEVNSRTDTLAYSFSRFHVLTHRYIEIIM